MTLEGCSRFCGNRLEDIYIFALAGHHIWDSLQIPDEEKYTLEHPWKDKVFYVEWRTEDQSNVKVYDQKRMVEYADYKLGLFYPSPFDLFVEVEPVNTKLEKKEVQVSLRMMTGKFPAKAITIANRNRESGREMGFFSGVFASFGI